MDMEFWDTKNAYKQSTKSILCILITEHSLYNT